jgi:hypothetical protein
MGKRKNPAHCKHYPLCEPLKSVIGKLSLKFLDSYTSILPREVESICNHCADFEQKEMPGISK